MYNFQVKDHFNSSHKGESFYAYSSANKCLTCYQGPFQNFPDLLEHLAFNHPESIDKFKEDNPKDEKNKAKQKKSKKEVNNSKKDEVLNPPTSCSRSSKRQSNSWPNCEKYFQKDQWRKKAS